jgi:hypothetical protein
MLGFVISICRCFSAPTTPARAYQTESNPARSRQSAPAEARGSGGWGEVSGAKMVAMSRSQPEHTAGGGPELEDVARELYTVRPDEFVAARDERAKATRAAGNRSLAREIGRLRRPTQSAWLVNLLWRDQQQVMEDLFDLADEFRAALGQGAGKGLQELTAQRRAIESALTQRARALAGAAGVKVSTDLLREAQETLAAALSDPGVAAEVRSGRLVKPATYAGFGGMPPDLRVVPGGRTGAEDAADGDRGVAGRDQDAADRDQDAADRDRAAAERRVRAAQDALDRAEAELADRIRAADRAERHHAELRDRLAQLRQELAEMEQQEHAAAEATLAEQRRRAEAEESVDQAREAVARAQRQLG